jgi:hypothetical protein
MLMITLPGGGEVSFMQASSMVQVMDEMSGRGEKFHWHFNDCGCCVSVHGSDCAYVIGRDGEATFYASKGCACE